MDGSVQARTISLTEVLVALVVVFIWSAAFVSGVAIVLMLVQDRTELAMAAPTPQPVVVVVTATPAATDTPTATATATTGLATASPAISVPTATFTRVILPTPEPVESEVPTATATMFVVPTYAQPVQIAMGEQGHIIHSVSAGETLSSIATMYGASIESLVKTNHIQNPAQISIGLQLTVPNDEAAESSSPGPSAEVNAPVHNSPANPDAPPELVSAIEPPPPAGDPPTRLIIPKINMDTPVVEVGWHIVEEHGHRFSEWDVADQVAGWHRGSAYPGNIGNTVISGHHNIKGEVFRYVIDLEAGDQIYLYVGDQMYPYTVTEKHILAEKGMSDEIRSENARWISQKTDERVTLVTCWPYTNNTHRLIVVAKPTWKLNR